jgi:hypothetical protein
MGHCTWGIFSKIACMIRELTEVRSSSSFVLRGRYIASPSRKVQYMALYTLVESVVMRLVQIRNQAASSELAPRCLYKQSSWSTINLAPCFIFILIFPSRNNNTIHTSEQQKSIILSEFTHSNSHLHVAD